MKSKPASDTGADAEQRAVEYLKQKSFGILQRNYRIPRGEIDIIAQDGNVLVFVEVKYLKNAKYFPEEQVTRAKMQKLCHAAESFLQYHPHQGPCRFDVIAMIQNSNDIDIRHVTDAFELNH